MRAGGLVLGAFTTILARPVVLPFRIRATPARDTANVIRKSVAQWPDERLAHPDLLLAAHTFGAMNSTEDQCAGSLSRCKAYRNEPIYSALVESQYARAAGCPAAEQCWGTRPVYNRLSGSLSAQEVSSGIRLLYMSEQSDKITDKAWVRYFSDWLDSMPYFRDIKHVTEALQVAHSAFLVSKRDEDRLRFAMKLERLITHPIATLTLIEGKELVPKAEFLSAASAALNDVEPEFEQLYGFRLGIASLITDALSGLKARATTISALSRMGAVLFNLEDRGLYSVIVSRDGATVDYTVTTPTRQVARNVTLRLAPEYSDTWTWSQQLESSWTATTEQDGVWEAPHVRVDSPHGQIDFNPSNLRAPLLGSCEGILYQDNDGQWKEHMKVSQAKLKVQGDDLLIWQQSCVTAETDVTVQICEADTTLCETRATLTSPLGFAFLPLDRENLKSFGSNTIYVSSRTGRSAEFSIEDPLITVMKASEIVEGPDGLKRTSNDLEYTFRSEHPPTSWVGALLWTGLSLAVPVAAWVILKRLEMPVLPGVSKEVPRWGGRRIAIMAVSGLYVMVLLTTLVRYWIGGNLISYAALLLPAVAIGWVISLFLGTEIERGLKSV